MSTSADAPTEPASEAWFGADQGIALGARLGRYELVRAVGAGGMGVVFEAKDPELDRTVAVKVLRSKGPGSEGELRLRREGQTMARLTHPNVIRVYDVGVAHGHMFVAMEFIAGGTLSDWLEQAPRSAPEILAVFAQAGRGLAAAHEAGLVHRDFKPSNVMVSGDGRVLVTDFGLARAATDAPDARGPTDGIAPLDVTATGQFVGTPAYMAPEQYISAKVDARADQFSFCVSLWRALYGTAPYGGSSVEELVTASERGALVPPPPSALGRASPLLRVALERGLRYAPAERFESMRDLLMAIEPRPSRARAWMLAGLGGAAVAAVIVLGVIASRSEADPCPAPTRQVDAAWTAAREQTLRAHLAAIDPTAGAQRAAAAAAVFDREVPRWRDMQVAACRATRVDGKQSDTMLDTRMRCLDDWLAHVGSVATALEAAKDPGTLESAIKGIGAIGPLDDCADITALEPAKLPTAPDQRGAAIAILAEVKAIDQARAAGELDGLIARADAVVARARQIDGTAALTRAVGIRWRVSVATGDIAGALTFLHELTEVAARAHDDEEAAKAWALMGRLTAYQGHPDQGKVMLTAARGAMARAGEPAALKAMVLTTEADVFAAASELDAALADLTLARKILVELGADKPGSPYAPDLAGLLMTLGTTYYYKNELDAAAAQHREAIALYDRIYGPETVESAASHMDLAQVLRDQADYEEAEKVAQEGVRIRELRGGETPALAGALMTLADIVNYREREPEAVALGERALRIAKATMPADDMQLKMITLGVAGYYDDIGRTREALTMYETTLAELERDHIDNVNLPAWNLVRGDMERRLGMYATAIEHYKLGASLGQQMFGPEAEAIGTGLRGQAECLHQLHKDRDAIALLEQSLGSPVPAYAIEDGALGTGLLGMLLVDTGVDRARGLSLVRAASASLRDENSTDPRRKRLDTWLARRDK